MSRRNISGGDSPVSLFPFLSILACMIGTLTLMITALALTGMGTGRDDASIQRAEDYLALCKQTASEQNKADEFHKSLRQAESLKAKVTVLQALLKSQDIAAEISRKVTLVNEQAKSAQSRTSTLESEFARLKKELDALRQELAVRQQTFSRELVEVLPPKGVSITKFKPCFVEAGQTGLTVYDGPAPYKVKNSEITTHKKLEDLMSRLAGNDTAQLVVLVRSDGLSAMNAVIARAEGKGINCGKLPLIGAGEVDLSSF